MSTVTTYTSTLYKLFKTLFIVSLFFFISVQNITTVFADCDSRLWFEGLGYDNDANEIFLYDLDVPSKTVTISGSIEVGIVKASPVNTHSCADENEIYPLTATPGANNTLELFVNGTKVYTFTNADIIEDYGSNYCNNNIDYYTYQLPANVTYTSATVPENIQVEVRGHNDGLQQGSMYLDPEGFIVCNPSISVPRDHTIYDRIQLVNSEPTIADPNPTCNQFNVTISDADLSPGDLPSNFEYSVQVKDPTAPPDEQQIMDVITFTEEDGLNVNIDDSFTEFPTHYYGSNYKIIVWVLDFDSSGNSLGSQQMPLYDWDRSGCTTAPTCTITNLPATAVTGQSVNFDVSMNDAEDDWMYLDLNYGNGTVNYPEGRNGKYYDGFNNTIQNFERIWNTPGTYTVRGTVSEKYGLNGTCQDTITIDTNDTTPPTCGTISSVPAWNSNNVVTYNTGSPPATVVTVQCVDSGVGCVQSSYATNVSSSGNYSVNISDNNGNTAACPFDIHFNKRVTRNVTFNPHINGTTNQCSITVELEDPDRNTDDSNIQIFANTNAGYTTSGAKVLRYWNPATSTRTFTFSINNQDLYDMGSSAYVHARFGDRADDGTLYDVSGYSFDPGAGPYNFGACVVDSTSPTCTIRKDSPTGPIIPNNATYSGPITVYSQCNDGSGSGCMTPDTDNQYYGSDGTYTYSHTYRDNWNNTVNCSVNFIIDSGSTDNSPECSLSASPASGSDPLSTTFTYDAYDIDNDIDTVTLYFDYLNDINNDRVVSPGLNQTESYTYTSVGTYQARLRIVDDNNNTADCTQFIVVNSTPNTPPQCNLTLTPNSGEEPLDVSFVYSATDAEDDNSSLDVTILYGTGSSRNLTGGINRTHNYTYTSAGTFTPILRVVDSNGSSVDCTDGSINVTTGDTYVEYPPEMKSDNECIVNPDGSVTVQRHTVTEVDDNGTITYHDDYKIGGYVTVVQEDTCVDLSRMARWPFDPLNQHMSEITYEVGSLIESGKTYCFASGAKDTRNRRTFPPQNLTCTVPEANNPPEVDDIIFPDGVTNPDHTGPLYYIGGDEINPIEIYVSDIDGGSQIVAIASFHTFDSGINVSSKGILYRDGNFYAFDKPDSVSKGQLENDLRDGMSIGGSPLELIGANGATNLTYETQYYVFTDFEVLNNGLNGKLLKYNVEFTDDFAIKVLERGFGDEVIPSKQSAMEIAVLDDLDIGTLDTLYYVDVLNPNENVAYPTKSEFIRGRKDLTIRWDQVSDNSPTSGLDPNGLTLAYHVNASNPDICNLYQQVGTASGRGCNTMLGYIYDIEVYPGEFERYYSTEKVQVGAPIFEIPYSQIVASRLSTDRISGDYMWDLDAGEPYLDEKDLKTVIALKDSIGNYSVDTSQESFGIDSYPPEVRDITEGVYTQSTNDQRGYVKIVWPKSTDNVSGVSAYTVLKGYATGKRTMVVSEKAAYIELGKPMPPGVTETPTGFIFMDYDAYALTPPSPINFLEGDGSASHDEFVWSDNYYITSNWEKYEMNDERYGYEINSVDNVGWDDSSPTFIVNNVNDPIVEYRIEWERFDFEDTLNPGDGTIEEAIIVPHKGSYNDDQVYTSPLLSSGKWYVHITAINSYGEESSTEYAGPFLLGGIKPELEFNYITGYFENGSESNYSFTVNSDPTNVHYNMPIVTSNFDKVDLTVSSYSNIDGITVDSVKVMSINGEIPYDTIEFVNDPGTEIFKYDYNDTGGSLKLDPLIRFNSIRLRATDELGITKDFEGIIEYVPESHIDVKLTADASAALTTSQIQFDNDAQNGDDLIQFDATISSPGIKGLAASYYSDTSFNVLSKTRIERDIAHGDYDDLGNHINGRTEMRTLAQVDSDENYSVRFEGRFRVPESGDYTFRYDLGAGDRVEMYIDTLDSPFFNHNNPANWPVAQETETIHLDQGVWYGVVIKYVATHTGSLNGDDIIRLDWKYQRDGADFWTEYETIDKTYLAYNAGNIAKIFDDYDVTISLPEGIIYETSIDPVVSYFTDSGSYTTNLVLFPDEIQPYDTLTGEPYITEDEPIQTLRWHFDSPSTESDTPPYTPISTVLPVGDSLKITFFGRAEIARRISNQSN